MEFTPASNPVSGVDEHPPRVVVVVENVVVVDVVDVVVELDVVVDVVA